jgi:streptomycin 3"-adenylyltransferase
VIPQQAQEIAAQLAAALGDALVGVYLHGSFALGCGNPNGSDLDLLVVTRRALTQEERSAFADLPAGTLDRRGWPRPLELSSLTLDQLRPWRHPTPYDLHLTHRGVAGPGDDPDLAAHVTVTRRAGIAVVGPPPADVFPEVPRADYEDALRRDFRWAVEKAPAEPRYLRYATLSLARVWAQLAEPEVLHTKETGAVWALERLPPELRRPLEFALESYRTNGRDIDVDVDEFRAYAAHVEAQVGA